MSKNAQSDKKSEKQKEADGSDCGGQSNLNTRKRNRRPSHEEFKEEFTLFKQEMRDMFNSWKSTQDASANKITNNINSMKTKFDEMCTSNMQIKEGMTFLSKQYDDMKVQVEVLQKEHIQQRAEMYTLVDTIEELQRASKLSKLEIRNIPQTSNETKEDLLKTVRKITSIICEGTQLAVTPVLQDVYRLPNKNNSVKTVIVDLQSPLLKNNVLKSFRSFNIRNKSNRLNTSYIGCSENQLPIYIDEHLTYKTKKLFYEAREYKKAHQYKYCWTSNGRIYLKKTEGGPAILVKNEAQLELLKNPM